MLFNLSHSVDDTVEKLFETFLVPDDLQVPSLNPHITVTDRSVLTRIDQTKVHDFEEVKELILF